MKIPDLKFLFLLILMTILFGLSFVASKIALQSLGVFQLIFGRYIFALLLLSGILWRRRHTLIIAKKHWKYFLLLTLIEPVGYFIFETSGVKYTTPASVSLIIATIPVFSLVFSYWILKEKNTFLGITGIFISLFGVYFIVSGQKATTLAPNPLLGNLLTLGAAFSAGLYNVYCRKLSQTYSPVTITFYQTVIATMVFFPLSFLEGYQHLTMLPDIKVLSSVLYLALGCSVGAYLILNYLLSKLNASQVATFANLIPVVTITASWMLFKEILNLNQIAGSILIVSGVYLTFIKSPKPPVAPPG